MAFLDSLGSYNGSSGIAQWTNRLLLIGLGLFSLSVPHSIAAAHIGLSLSLLCWIGRDGASARLHFTRTAFDLPLVCFSGLTILSSLFSEEPRLSLRKLLSLLLFGVIYLIASNVTRKGVCWLTALLLLSSLIGAGFSLVEKVRGRGITINTIHPDSPLAGSPFAAGDVIWMIARNRVRTPDDIRRIVGQMRAGESTEIEGIHNGDPLPVQVRITEVMKSRNNPLAVDLGGPSRRFRASGFSRHFLTFAEQMQIMGLLVFGGLVVAFLRSKRPWLLVIAFGVLSAALVLTASRGVLVSYLLALVLISLLSARRGVVVTTLATAGLLGVISAAVLISTRTANVAQLIDDSSSRRIGYMRAGLRLIPDHPLLGVGMDSHKLHWKEWGFPGEYVTHTHSTPIQIALDRGLPALASLIWFFLAVALWTWRRKRIARDERDLFGEGLVLGTIGALAGFGASSLINYNFGDSEVLLLMLALVGLVVAWFGEGNARETLEVPSPSEG